MDYTEKRLRSINRYEGLIINVQVDQIQLHSGNTTIREVVEHPGGVTVIPVDDEGYVYCVRQYRYPFAEHLLEVPAGKLEDCEDHRDCAARELAEETGIMAGELTYMGEIYTSPGFSKEILHLYLATDLTFGEAHLDENEFMDVVKIHIDELIKMVMAGEIKDAKSIVAILKTKEILEA
ncbi:MAG TPA: NUDIX hydrolase [Clostridiales bacterium]|nr:NUDIX hydrolase [Clostridiales bacterium]